MGAGKLVSASAHNDPSNVLQTQIEHKAGKPKFQIKTGVK